MRGGRTAIQEIVDLDEIDAIAEAVGRTPRSVIALLQAVQSVYHYLPKEALSRICETTEITPSQISGVASFYSQFRLSPAGKHTVKVCIGTACHIKGAEQVLDAFKSHLGIAESEDTDADGMFTVEKVACLGCCMLAPAVQIDQLTYGFLSPRRVPQVLQDFISSQDQGITEQVKPASGMGTARLCICSSCIAAGSAKVLEELTRQVKVSGFPVEVQTTGCTGISFETPLLEIEQRNGQTFRYGRIQPRHVRDILLRHFRPGTATARIRAAGSRLLERLLTRERRERVTRYSVDLEDGLQSAYWGRQIHIATEHAGLLNPLDLDAYIEHGGFEGLKRCCSELSPEETIAMISKAGLRGRGGAGFKTAVKWGGVRAAKSDTKYVLCNGDEGDPGAFMDRLILESFPFRVIEGLTIAAITIGASRAFIYVRSEYPLAVTRIREAIRLCGERNLTASQIDLELVEGAGAFVCGEETALIAAIEGRRGTPHFRPPYPHESGLWGKPTLVNNVETFALVPWILRNGPERFVELGTEKSHGTKTFALAGKVVRGGLIEVPMGMTLREIVEVIGGGIQGGRRLKAVQVGGPSGGCIPESLLDTPVDYEALANAGAMMGSGGLIALDETDCMVDIARYFMVFTQAESCGRCTFCRIGTKRMLEILERLCSGDGREGDIENLERLANTTAAGSLCGLGKTAPNPVLTTMKYFREEYIAHTKGRCPAKKCRALITYRITDKCIGCTRCAQRCPAGAIEMRPYEQHEIDPNKCVRCGTCHQVCPSDAVEVIEGGLGHAPTYH